MIQAESEARRRQRWRVRVLRLDATQWGLRFNLFAEITLENSTACSPSVSTMSGLMELMRILRGPSSLASDLVTASTAALVAL